MLGLLLLQVLVPLAGTQRDNALEPQKPAWICKLYSNLYHYAIMYDRNRRIPVYSAYIYKPGSGSRSKLCFLNPREAKYALQGYGYREVHQKMIHDHFIANWPESGYHPRLQQPPESGPCKVATTASGLPSPSPTLCPRTKHTTKVPGKCTRTKQCPRKPRAVIPPMSSRVLCLGTPKSPIRGLIYPATSGSAACCQTKTNRKAWAVIAENKQNQVQNLTLAQLEASLSQLYGRGQ
ncbi:hypothetical protein Nmel_005059, partial [Mimus melanotis]